MLFPVHPTTVARHRETFTPSGAKGDPSDTDSVLRQITMGLEEIVIELLPSAVRVVPSTQRSRIISRSWVAKPDRSVNIKRPVGVPPLLFTQNRDPSPFPEHGRPADTRWDLS